MSSGAFICLIFTLSAYLSNASPAKATDKFTSPCGFLQDPIQSGSAPTWKPKVAAQQWSSPSTWPNRIVPGIGGASGANVTIDCGKYVIMDLPNVTLGLLQVKGLLTFLDSPNVPVINLKANFILVEGQLFIGSALQQYRSKAIIELTPNNGRAPLKYTSNPPADSSNPRDLGHKAFVVIGGQVRFHGLQSTSSMPVWVKLSKNANVGDRRIQVDADVAGQWKVGSRIIVTSTDYNINQSENFKIIQVQKTGPSQSIITLHKAMEYNHYGTINGISDGFGGFIDQRAEVMLLTRNIVITGTEEPAPYDLEGGHFMVFQTPYPPQYVEGVELHNMGQQGKIGRYPLHFHLLGSVPGTVCRKNAIHHSKQRCIVVHATHNLTVDSNVAYDTVGHCFMLEEGGEMHNVFKNNVGALTRKASKLISSDESDNRPSTFWMSNVDNSWVGNVAAGSEDSGFWFELRFSVRGASREIPSLENIVPVEQVLRLFTGNTAHSSRVGLQTYPFLGMRPRNNGVIGPKNVLDNLVCYKNFHNGVFVHRTDSLTIINSAFSDNGWGINFNHNHRITVKNSRFVGLSSNYGTPKDCHSSNPRVDCRPTSLDSCTMPLAKGEQGRSTGGRGRYIPNFAMVVDPGSPKDFYPYSIKNVTFSNYYSACTKFAAIVAFGPGETWNPSFNIQSLRFSSNSQPVWLAPTLVNSPQYEYDAGLEQSKFLAIFDRDGSLSQGKPGYVLSKTNEILPSNRAGCTLKDEWNAYFCTGVCYRTLLVTYQDPALKSGRQFSNLRVTRASDKQSIVLTGNSIDAGKSSERRFLVNLLGGQTYDLEVVSSSGSPGSITVEMNDVGLCQQGLTVRLKQESSNPWGIEAKDNIYYDICPGSKPYLRSEAVALYKASCVGSQPYFQIKLTTTFNDIPVTVTKGNGRASCSSTFTCSLSWSGSYWFYDQSGEERRPGFYSPKLLEPGNWKKGRGIFGLRSKYVVTTLETPRRFSLVTYYFRRQFVTKDASLYSSLAIEVFNIDGFVMYLNGNEVYRFNMPSGPIDSQTNAVRKFSAESWTSLTFPIGPKALVEGENTLAVEVHTAPSAYNVLFDMRVAGVKK